MMYHKYEAIPDPDEPDDLDGPVRTWLVIASKSGLPLAGGLSQDEAERIARCVNLWRGVGTEDIPTGILMRTAPGRYRAAPDA